jgi:tetratricopeptide (TPR) repeat protein
LNEAVAEWRAAIRINPDDTEARNNLGNALRDEGKLDEAVAEYREAIRLKPDHPGVRYNLGNVLRNQGKLDEAVAEYREAIRLKPDHATAHTNLGITLADQGKRDEAIAEYREAIRLKPELAEAHCNLGIALSYQGKHNEAITEYRAAIRLKPNYTEAHYSLGIALSGQGKLDEAAAEYREAIWLKPDYAEPHCNLGGVLRRQGNYAESLAEYRKGHDLGSKQRGWPYPSAEWVRQAEQLRALAGRVPAVLKGADKPKDPAEGQTLAQMCYDKALHAAAVQLWADAFAADPKLAEDRQSLSRYNAACAAALAAAGAGKHEPRLDEPAKAKLRLQASDWLNAELAAWTKILESGQSQARGDVARNMSHWKQDSDLAGIRDADALAKLPADEQRAWRALWGDVDSLLKRAQAQR